MNEISFGILEQCQHDCGMKSNPGPACLYPAVCAFSLVGQRTVVTPHNSHFPCFFANGTMVCGSND